MDKGLRWRALTLAVGLLGLGSSSAWAQALPGASVVTTPQVRAELVAHAPQGVAAGQPLWLGLKIDHQPHWHTYWKNAGDSGLPTSLQWTLPASLQAGDIAWPTPQKLPVGPLMNFGYEGTLLLPVPVTVGDVSGDALLIKLEAQWLVCKEICIPEQGSFELQLPTRASTAGQGALFEAAQAAQPINPKSVKATAVLVPQALQLKLQGLPEAWQNQALQALPELGGVLDHAAPTQGQWRDGVWQASLPLSRERYESPTNMAMVLLRPGAKQGLRVAFDVQGTWPALGSAPAAALGTAAESPVGTTVPASPAGSAADAMGWWTALVLAWLGGLLLNLMPCVLPVLSLKALGLAHAGTPAERRAAGLAYTAGVVMSLVALAAALIALRQAGEAVGWGFQLQSPLVVVALACLFSLLGLNLAGVFEVNAGAGNLASVRSRHSTLDAWLTGVLAVAVAAPCTAPFMGAALGYALGLSAPQALIVFAVLGLGLAAPFLLLSFWPSLTAWLPRPGAWMQRFKVGMAFPMFATVVWLVWVLGQQVGLDGAALLLATLVVLSLLAWAWGWRQATGAKVGHGATPARAPLLVMLTATALLVALLTWAWPSWQGPQDNARASAAGSAAPGSESPWQPWSAAQVSAFNQAGRTVFVDFTAAWCVTCQVNKRTTLAQAEVLAAFRDQQVVTMRADWTRRDPAIAAAIRSLGREGVPVYVVYRAGQPPQLLPELLTPSLVIAALKGPATSR